jgi:two-component system phosphate regulon sensor histidine kinase PhoR
MFWHQFGTYAVLILASLGLVGVLVANRVERDRLQQIEERLRAETVLIQELIRGKSEEQIADLHQRLRHLGQRMGTRITLIAADGRVLADSAFDDASGLDNHLNRPEIQAARAGQPGTATRFSTSVGQSMLYVTLHTAPARQAVTYVRAAVPLHDIEEQIAELRRLLWTAAGLTALVALGVAFLLARRVAQPLQELTEGAERIAAGAYGHKVYTETRDEVGTLARAFNQMSDRLAAQFAQLDEDRQKLRTVLSSMTEGVLAVDTEQRVLFANERAAQLLEFPPAGAVGRRLWELVRQRPIHEIVQRALVEQDCQGRELDWTGPSAKTLRVHVGRLAGSPPRGAVLVFHDTSELRRLENLRQEFVANVSHELKTPLSVIKACVETLLDGAAEDAQHRGRFLERIQDQADRLHMLILDLLSLARIESGTATFHFEAVDLQQVAQACQERHRARAEAKQQQLLTVAPARRRSARSSITLWITPSSTRRPEGGFKSGGGPATPRRSWKCRTRASA